MKLLEVLKLVHGMDTTRRYSNSRLIIDENILSHSASVVLMTSLMYDIAVEASPDLAKVVDKGELLTKAICHDAPEVSTGDLPRTVKYWNESISKAYEEVEIEASHEIFNNLKISKELANRYAEYAVNSKEGVGGIFIRVSDVIAVTYKMYSEVLLLSNPGMLLTCSSMPEYLRSLRTHVDEALKEYPEACKVVQDVVDQALDLTILITNRHPEINI